MTAQTQQMQNSAFWKSVYEPQYSPVAEYLKTDTPEFASISIRQITVPRCKRSAEKRKESEKQTVDTVGTVEIYKDVINEKGAELLTKTLQRVAAKDFKDTLCNYVVDRTSSGFWFDKNTGLGHWHTFNNHFISGDLLSDPQQRVDTSALVFYDEDSGWALTHSGSLYALVDPLKE